MRNYLGFSTYNRAKKFKLVNFDLVRQDLFNHFHIRKGEKLMNPDFGTIIWDMLHEPYTIAVRDAIAEDVKRIVGYDPRISVRDLTVVEFTDGISIEVDITYVPTNQTSRMTMQFDRNIGSVRG